MNTAIDLLGLSDRMRANLVIGATFLFLAFAGYALVFSAQLGPRIGQGLQDDPAHGRNVLHELAILTGLASGLVLLAIAAV